MANTDRQTDTRTTLRQNMRTGIGRIYALHAMWPNKMIKKQKFTVVLRCPRRLGRFRREWWAEIIDQVG